MFFIFILKHFIILSIFLTFLVKCREVVIKSKDSTVVFAYRPGIEGESGLGICEPNEACNIVHNRFWLPTLTERLCRCTEGRECPWNWNYIKTSNRSSDSSIIINNRSVLQFCSPTNLKNMKICSSKESAITFLGESNHNNSLQYPLSIKANCKCRNPFFWILQKAKYIENKSVLQVYKCATQWMCDPLEFCGHVRTDLFSIYYRCTCPEKHWCIFQTNKQEAENYVHELAYTGTAFKAYCIPHS
ncbi:kappa-scoloptoxin(11)-Ssd1b-like [Leptopilina boulardi]|uniref:kappa-scoloptoxin(11)-Ssd1b-like n=1 Tax=Leptopilina boulardi TaxID=63433 RepID=UPI0021F66D89|nr:kappa-scoloptoxin(11)-Ssd1b-like [Leptopilina boulardi]